MNDHIEDLLNQVIDYAWDHNIGCSTIPLHEDQGPLVDTEARLIILNNKWPNANELPFQAAHECAHILNGDNGKLRYTNQYTKSRTENGANQRNVRYQLSFQCISQTFQKNQQTLTNS